MRIPLIDSFDVCPEVDTLDKVNSIVNEVLICLFIIIRSSELCKGAASLKLGGHELDLDKECMDQESHVKQVLIYEESGVTQRSVPPLAHVMFQAEREAVVLHCLHCDDFPWFATWKCFHT